MKTTISNELCLQPRNNGIVLVNPDKLCSPSDFDQFNIGNLMDYRCNVYFLGNQGEFVKTNHEQISVSGQISLEYCIDKDSFFFLQPTQATRVLNNNKNIMHSKKFAFFEEDALFKDNKNNYKCLSIKFPWIDSSDQLIGVFGFSIVFGIHSFSESLQAITKLGLFSPQAYNFFTKDNLLNLSKQQTAIAKGLVRGKTTKEIAKQLNLSNRTAEHYIEHIKDKLNVSTKSALIDKLFSSFSKENN